MSVPKKWASYLYQLEKESGIKPEEFIPISTWFSYGSNLFRQDFERKMLEHGSYLSLVRARSARLEGYERKLDNESDTRGLAYSTRKGPSNSFVDGIVHDVPIGDLPAFLRFEGILDRNYNLKRHEDERRYDIEKAAPAPTLFSTKETQNCFVLIGCCTISDNADRIKRAGPEKDKLIKYIRTSIKGAVDFGIDVGPFQKYLRWVENIHRV